jgi:CTP synthase
VIQALDVPSIYDVPMAYHKEGLDTEVWPPSASIRRPAPRMGAGKSIERIHNPEGEVTIAIVGKYTGLKDAYKSLIEALYHGGIANRVKVKLEWIERRSSRRKTVALAGKGARHPGARRLWRARRGRQDRRCAVRARTQGALFRHLLRHADGGARRGAQSGRHRTPCLPSSARRRHPCCRADDRMAQGQPARDARRRSGDLGGTMRLGAYDAKLAEGSRVADVYGASEISERHRHRYEVNMRYREQLEGSRFRERRRTGFSLKLSKFAIIHGSSAFNTIRN